MIAVRVYNYGDPGGFYRGAVKIVKPSLKDFANLSLVAETGGYKAVLATSEQTSGTLNMTVTDILTGTLVLFVSLPVSIYSRIQSG